MDLLRQSNRTAPNEEWLSSELDLIHTNNLEKKFVELSQTGKKYSNPDNSSVAWLLDFTDVCPDGPPRNLFPISTRKGTLPDVDVDIADKDRHLILEFLSTLEVNGVKYKTSQIGTFSTFAQAKDDPNDTGSVFNKYVSYLRGQHMDQAWAAEKAKAEANGVKPVKYKADESGSVSFNMSDDHKIKRLEDVKIIRPDDYTALKEIINMKSVYASKGTHAGGVLVSGVDTRIEEYVPLMLIPGASKDTVVTQYSMKDVEQLGLLKMDWLGQTSLTVMQKTQEFMGKENTLDFTWIPFDDPQVLKFVGTRKNHPGIFHLEAFPKSIAMQELQPKSTRDFVIHQAYSMPGATDSGAKEIYLQRRKNPDAWTPDYEHPLLHAVFDPTNAVMIYQEQALDVCRGVGFIGSELNTVFKLLKDSGAGAIERNAARLEVFQGRFRELALAEGLTPAEIDWVWHQMVAMGGYAFSINHSTGYGIRSYRTAYLKYYHPVEYMAALLYCWAGSSTSVGKGARKVKKEDHYLTEAKRLGVSILPPRLSQSKANWTVEGNGIRKGFRSIAGVGPVAAQNIEDNGPYESLLDLATRGKISGGPAHLKDPNAPLKGILKKLDDLNVADFY